MAAASGRTQTVLAGPTFQRSRWVWRGFPIRVTSPEQAPHDSEAAGSTQATSRPSLAGLSVCFTGELLSRLDGEPITRDRAHELATGAGLDVRKSVTKKLDLLVVADPATASGKARKAREYGTRVMAEGAFWAALGIQVE